MPAGPPEFKSPLGHSQAQFRDLFDPPMMFRETDLGRATNSGRCRVSSTAPEVTHAGVEGARDDVDPTRAALAVVLDAFADAGAAPREFLGDFIGTWLEQRRTEGCLDWRYYLVRYPCMREGGTGIYYGTAGVLGYSLCMLRRTQLNSWYRDPFLLAVLRESGVDEAVRDPWFTGTRLPPAGWNCSAAAPDCGRRSPASPSIRRISRRTGHFSRSCLPSATTWCMTATGSGSPSRSESFQAAPSSTSRTEFRSAPPC